MWQWLEGDKTGCGGNSEPLRRAVTLLGRMELGLLGAVPASYQELF